MSSNAIPHMMIGASGVAPLVTDFVLFFKFPRYSDVYCISSEIQLTLRVEIICLVGYYLGAALMSPQRGSLTYIWTFFISGTTAFLFSLVVNLYALCKFGMPWLPCRACGAAQSHVDRTSLAAYVGQRGSGVGDKDKEEHTNFVQKLREILLDKHGFTEFAMHLSKEFCIGMFPDQLSPPIRYKKTWTENLFFFVETQQWLRALSKKQGYAVFRSNAREKDMIHIEMTAHAPKSTIIAVRSLEGPPGDSKTGSVKKSKSVAVIVNDFSHSLAGLSRARSGSEEDESEADDDTEFATLSECVQGAALFDKFVSNDAYFCVNISGEARDDLYALFGAKTDDAGSLKMESMVRHLRQSKVTKKQMWLAFDESRKSIFLLLLQSLGRFVQTECFPKLNRSLSRSASHASHAHLTP